MTLDVIALVIAGAFALLGAIGGFTGGLAHLVAVVLGLTASVLSQQPIGDALSARFRWPSPAGHAMAMVGVFFAVTLVAHWALLRLTRRFRQSEKSGLSRLLGAALGLVAGTTMVLVAAFAVTFMEEPVPGFSDRWRFHTEKSSVSDLARRYNPLVLWSWELVPTLRRAVRVAGDARVAELVRENNALAVLVADPRVQALANDKTLKKAVAAGDDLALLRRPEVLQLLRDPDILMKLSRIAGVEK